LNKPRILVVEDEVKVASLLADYLTDSGFDNYCLHTGDGAIDEFKHYQPDLVLLDLMLPVKDGLTICKEIRALSNTPVIMITARVEEIDRLLGLELGADDYICKPFSPREVVARVKAVLRRTSNLNNDANKLSILQLDENKLLARVYGEKLTLTPVEFRLISVFNANPGRVFSREQLLNTAYNDYRVVSDRTIDSHIKNLRKKLVALAPDIEWIESVYGVGYRFIEE
jgi:two-component system response regulator BaeR